MDSIQRLLAQQPLLSALDPASVELIRPITRLVRFAPGSLVLCAADPADEFLLLSQGSVAIRAALEGEDTDRHIFLRTVVAGELLGASWLLSARQWSFDVVAIDAVEALAIDVNDFFWLCQQEHSFGYRIMKAVGQVIAQRLRETELQISDVYANWS
jgi:CRP/FNR family transcriptional regulator, cyclic AMP receptor protein